MAHSYPVFFWLLLAGPAVAQTSDAPAPTSPERPPFRGTLADSLAAGPTPAGTLRLQGQEQPVRPFLTVQDQLRTVAGVQVTPYDGSPGSGQVVRIRGASQWQGTGQPLYVVDGLPALNDELTPDQWLRTMGVPPPYETNLNTPAASIAAQHAEAGANPLHLLPPEAIERVEVLAGPAAVARYGPLAANGVVSIRTRHAAGSGRQPLRVHYSAYAGVQQVRQRYELLGASEFAAIANQAALNQGASASYLPYPSTQLGAGTDWQAETYRVAGLQQHQVSLEGRTPRTGYRVSADYRQQSGVLRGSDLSRYGLRLALDQRPTEHLLLRASAALGQTDQRLPYTLDDNGAVRAALMAPPTAEVRTAQGTYSGYVSPTNSFIPDRFVNPLAVSEFSYLRPRTRRLLGQLAADYQAAPGLTVQAAANLQLTDLASQGYYPPQSYPFGPPTRSEQYSTQTYHNHQLAAQLAVHYERQLGGHHRVGAELDYQYQQFDYRAETAATFTTTYLPNQPGSPSATSSSGYTFGSSGTPRLHRPWARLHYALDSTLTVEAGLSYAHFREAAKTEFYPTAQLSWHWRAASGAPAPLPLTLWLGAGRTSVLAYGFGTFGAAQLTSPPLPVSSPLPAYPGRQQAPLYTDQVEAGLRLGQPSGHWSGQLTVYQRLSHHVLLSTTVPVANVGGQLQYLTLNDEGTIRNQGLELTGTAAWRAGRVQGATRLAVSFNRNRLVGDAYAVEHNIAFDNHPTGAFAGYQQEGLTATGMLRFRDVNGDGHYSQADQQYLGSGIPAQLASLSQQLRLGRLALDAQVDGQFGYQVQNHQLTFLDVPSGYANSATTVRNYWTPTAPATTVPAPGRPSYFYATTSQPFDRQLENGSHVRLSSLTLTYRLRQTATQDLSLWVGAQNLLVLGPYRGYDPNVSSGGSAPGQAGQDYAAVPVPRTWLAGVQLAL